MSQQIKTYDSRCNCRRQNALLVPGVSCVLQNKATQLAMRVEVLGTETPREELSEAIFHSSQGDGRGLRTVLESSLRHVINKGLRKIGPNVLDQRVT